MTVITVRDHAGHERTIHSVVDWERLVGEVERRRDELADTMLSSDPEAAREAEEQSDFIEQTIVPCLQAQAPRVQELADAEFALVRRRAKAQAIKARGASGG